MIFNISSVADEAPPVNQKRTRATIEMHNVFSGVPQFGSLRPIPKTDWEKNKTATEGKIPWSRCTTRTVRNKRRVSDDFLLRSPVIQKPFQTKTATFILAYVRRSAQLVLYLSCRARPGLRGSSAVTPSARIARSARATPTRLGPEVTMSTPAAMSRPHLV